MKDEPCLILENRNTRRWHESLLTNEQRTHIFFSNFQFESQHFNDICIKKKTCGDPAGGKNDFPAAFMDRHL